MWVVGLALLLGLVILVAESGAPAAPPVQPTPSVAARTTPVPPEAPQPLPPADDLADRGAGARLSGSVVDDETGAPVPNAAVVVAGARGVTDAKGRFSAPVLARGGPVAVTADGYRALSALWNGEPTLTLGMARVGMLMVRVVHAGKPVAAAQVALSPPEPPRSAQAEGQGVAVFQPLEGGAYAVSARNADGTLAGLAEAAVADREHVQVTVVLQPAAAMTGKVVEADGKDAPGAQVWAEAEDGTLLGQGVAGADGAFVLGGLPPTDKARVLAIKGGRQGRSALVALGRATRVDVGTLTLSKGGQHLSGSVLDENDLPVDGATVELGPVWSGGESTWAAVRTDAAGHFDFADLPEGIFDVTARLGELSAGRDAVKSGQRNVVLRLLSGARLVGRVVDTAGTPVGAFTVRAVPRRAYGPRPDDGRESRAPEASASATSSADGKFSAAPVGRGMYDVEVTTPDGAVGRVEAQVSGALTDVGDIRVETGGTITGRISNKRNGSMVSGAQVSNGARTATTGVDGRFSLAVPAGRHTVWVSHPGYFGKRVEVPEIRAGSSEDVGDVALVPGTRRDIEGRQGFGGVGATLREDKGNPVVEGLVGDSPAARAGLQKGDVILSVDGESMQGKGVQDAISNIRGEVGSNVWLRVRRGTEELSIPVRRESITLPGR